ncbi:MAG: PIN domain-containing protein [Ruminococcus sp.]|nr:PIN domain-containing protein [Ruminococcus sp.]
MVLLVDTNIVLDYLLKREPFYSDAKAVLKLCSSEDVDGCIALHTVTTIWYILRKVPDETRRFALKSICELLRVVGTTHEEVIAALDNTAFRDFEDCIQTKCAKTAKADYIVTRNDSDFIHSEIPVILPHEALGLSPKSAE